MSRFGAGQDSPNTLSRRAALEMLRGVQWHFNGVPVALERGR
jgi:hypothetical protein